MATKTQQQVPAPETPASSSCYFKKPEASTFFKNMKLRFDEFVHAPMDEHKACFKNTIQKVCISSKLSFQINNVICNYNINLRMHTYH